MKKTKKTPTELDVLKDEIYSSQFHSEEEDMQGHMTVFSGGAEEVLEAIQNLTSNPLLLKYIVKCLSNNGINISPFTLYYIVAQKYHYDSYPPLREIQIKDGTPKHIESTVIPQIFFKKTDAEDYIENHKQFDKYFIHIII